MKQLAQLLLLFIDKTLCFAITRNPVGGIDVKGPLEYLRVSLLKPLGIRNPLKKRNIIPVYFSPVVYGVGGFQAFAFNFRFAGS